MQSFEWKSMEGRRKDHGLQGWTQDERFLWAQGAPGTLQEASPARPELEWDLTTIFISRPSLGFKCPQEDRHSNAARVPLIHIVITSCVISSQKHDL